MNQKDNFTDVVEATDNQTQSPSQADTGQQVSDGHVIASDGEVVTLGQNSSNTK
jgi:hypothetical protein